jgi:hypothetical protein
LPLQLLVSRSSTADQLNAFFGTCLSAFIAVLVASKIFQWLNSNFSVASVLVLAAPFIVADLMRIRRFLKAWHASLVEAGLETARRVPSEQPEEARLLYHDVGREMAYLVGNLVGLALGGWYFLRETL